MDGEKTERTIVDATVGQVLACIHSETITLHEGADKRELGVSGAMYDLDEDTVYVEVYPEHKR